MGPDSPELRQGGFELTLSRDVTYGRAHVFKRALQLLMNRYG